jgi:hypothetical protein
LGGTGSVGFATTGAFSTTSGSASSRLTQIEQVYATTGSNSFRATQSITGSLTVTGQIIAQTLNVQQVTSSIVFSSGSNTFGCDLNSRQTFTGSVIMTGSLNVFGNISSSGNLRIDKDQPDIQLNILSASQFSRVYFFEGASGNGGVQLIGSSFTGPRKCRFEIFGNNAGISFIANGQFESPGMFISGSNVGIGTTDLSQGKLVVSNAGPSIIANRETSVGVNSYWNASDGSTVFFGSTSNHPLVFVTNNTTRLTFAAAGNACFNCSVTALQGIFRNSGVPAIQAIRDLNVVSVGTAGQGIEFGALNGTTPTAGAAIYGGLDNPATTGNLVFQTLTAGSLTTKLTIASSGASTFACSVTAAQFIAASSTNAAVISSTGTGGYGLVATGTAGGARDIFLAGQSGFSNGFTVQFNGSAMAYTFLSGNVGMGTSSPGAALDVYQLGGDNARTCHALYLRAGNNSDVFNSNQILFSYNGGTDYAHAIKTRHNSNNAIDNAFDFYTWKCGDAPGTKAGQYVMTIAGNGRVGIGTCAPSTTLHVAGNVTFNNTISSPGNFIATAGLNLYLRPASGNRVFIDTGDGLTVTGNISKGSGSFRIKHPLASKKCTHQLVHSFIEGPNADLIYSGHTKLIGGVSCINIDCVSRMTEGTFEALNRCVRIFTTNETSWSAVRGKVCGNIVVIESQDNTSEDEISWMVIGERQDSHMFDTEWTDNEGRVITEPEIEPQAQ